MRISYLISLAVATVLLTGCGDTSNPTTTYSTGQTTTNNTVTSEAADIVSAHHQGVSCAQCHSDGGTSSIVSIISNLFESDESEAPERSEESEGSEHPFTSGATIFNDLSANNGTAKVSNNYSLRLVLAQSGEKINYNTGRGSGNAYVTPNAGVAKYTAQVLNAEGVVVNSSATDSHDASRFDCNRCHTATGTNGAPGRIVSFHYTPTTEGTVTGQTTGGTTTTGTTGGTTTGGTTATPAKSFANNVLPILTTNCKGCHGGSGRFTITSSSTPYAGVLPFVDTTSPANSRLIQKGSGALRHGGGRQLTSTEFTTIRDWISQGANNN